MPGAPGTPNRAVTLLSCHHLAALQKRHLEKSDGELPNSFEQRVHIMLHRMGVTKGLVSESKKQQVRMELLMGKACTHTGGGGDGSMGRDGTEQCCPVN